VELHLKERAGSFLGWRADDPQWPRLEHYLLRVQEAGVPLVSHGDRERLVERHLIPSLESLPFIGEHGRLMDIGSGGGFPALPLAFARPHLSVLCVESNSRKAAFLRRVSRETELGNVQVIESRAEDLAAEYDHSADYLTSRAVADLSKLIAQAARFLKPGGRWLLYKGQSWRREGNPSGLGVHLVEERTLSDGSRLLVLASIESGNPP
jgi:16S rRNA (guanine(527)-N(7))-methyltransferase RsmG